MVDYFRSRLRIVEELLSRKYLEKKPDAELRSPQETLPHDLRGHWKHATRFLMGARRSQADLRHISLAILADVAAQSRRPKA